MSKSILEALYNGKINPWERERSHSPERAAIENKIKAEKQYFMDLIPPDTHKRFEGLENLYSEASDDDCEKIFSQGFILGTLIILEVMTGLEGVINE